MAQDHAADKMKDEQGERLHITPKWYKESLSADADYLALAFRFRASGNNLARAAARMIGTWEGHHRLSLALVDWYKVIADERRYKNPRKKLRTK